MYVICSLFMPLFEKDLSFHVEFVPSTIRHQRYHQFFSTTLSTPLPHFYHFPRTRDTHTPNLALLLLLLLLYCALISRSCWCTMSTSSTENGATLESIVVDMNTFWLLIGAILVFCKCHVCGCTCLDVAHEPIHDNPQRFFQLQSSAPFIILFLRQSLDLGCFDWGVSQSPDVLLRSSKLTFRGNKFFFYLLLPIFVECDTYNVIPTYTFTANARAWTSPISRSETLHATMGDRPISKPMRPFEKCVLWPSRQRKINRFHDRVISASDLSSDLFTSTAFQVESTLFFPESSPSYPRPSCAAPRVCLLRALGLDGGLVYGDQTTVMQTGFAMLEVRCCDCWVRLCYIFLVYSQIYGSCL